MEPPVACAEQKGLMLFAMAVAAAMALAGCSGEREGATLNDMSVGYRNHSDHIVWIEIETPAGNIYGNFTKGTQVHPRGDETAGRVAFGCGPPTPDFWLRITMKDEKDGQVIQVRNWTAAECDNDYRLIIDENLDMSLHEEKSGGRYGDALPTVPP